jgi:hypothetical protein
VRIPVTVADQLRLLHPGSASGGDLAEGLTRLSRAVALAVPSTVAVTIVLARPDREISLSALAAPATVLASLAVPLQAGAGLLVLRASTAGAYSALADDLGRRPGPDDRPAERDVHLSWPVLSGESLVAALADLASIDQAIGILIDEGFPIEDARPELGRRAGVANATVATVSRALVASQA